MVWRADAVTVGRLTLRDAARFLSGLPGIIIAVLAAFAAFQAYVSKREELAVARAAWQQTRDSLRNVLVTERLAAEARDRKRDAQLVVAQTTARQAGQQFATVAEALHAIVDSNETAKAALDSLEATHARQVLSLEQAVAIANDKVADRDTQLLRLRGDLAAAITRADGFEKQAHPGAIRRVLDSPVTHLIAFAGGMYVGSR